jgi:hypothetical protein
MAFVCPRCLVSGSLEINLAMQLPADSRSDDITVQIVECNQCKFYGLAVYEESRRGALELEAWEHTGYWLEADSDGIITEIKSCPEPMNANCRCPSHVALGQSDARGRWQGLVRLQHLRTFPMRMVL